MSRPVPFEALEGHALVVGTTGSGKSYLLRGLVEQLRADGRRVGAIDKLGNLWGLTVSADGKGPGFEFVVFGGRREGAVPMRPDDGARIGALFVERNLPAIFDVSAWHRDDQDIWVEGFCDAVFLENKSSLHLVLDEAQSWVPQGGGRNADSGTNAFAAVRRIAEQGRGYGIHLLMSVQRLSRIDKTVASMASTIVAMRQTGTGDRKAVRELVGGAADDVGDLYDELPKLPTGSGFVWNPVASTLTRQHFPANATFDSSRTPRHGDAPVEPIAISSKLVDELRALLDPPKPAPHPDDVIPDDPAEAYAEGSVVGEMLAERDRRIASLEQDLAVAEERADELEASCRGYASRLAAIEQLVNLPIEDLDTGPDEDEDADPVASDDASATAARGSADGDTAEKRDLRALGGLVAVHPAGLTEAAWAQRTGYSRKGGAWVRRRKGFVDAGWIEKRGDRWYATDAGVAAAGDDRPAMPAPGPSLVNWWADRLDRAPGRALRLLANVHPRPLTRDAIAAELNMAAGGGAFVRAISTLKTSELAVEAKRRLSLAPGLMGEA